MKHLNRHFAHRAAPRRPSSNGVHGLPRRTIALLVMTILFFTAPSYAQDSAQNAAQETTPNAQPTFPKSHTPEFCEFSTTFPSEPYTTRLCEDEDTQNKCYDQISYTQVFDMISTVNFRLICNKIDKDIYKSYNGDVMQVTLRAMTKQSVTQTFDTSFREDSAYKQAGLVGEGKVGLTPTIYIAQLWMGENSALSVEAEIIGDPIEAADKMFSDVLRSVGHKKSLRDLQSLRTESITNTDDAQSKPPAAEPAAPLN